MNMTSILYNKVLSGTASNFERLTFEEWLAFSELNREEFESIKLLWNAKEDLKDSEDHRNKNGFQEILIQRQRRNQNKSRKKLFRLISITVGLMALSYLCFVSYKDGSSPGAYLRFDNASIGEVFSTLENEYNIAIEIRNKEILECRFTGTFCNNQIKDILFSVSRSLNFKCDRLSDKRFIITGKGCSHIH